MQVTIAKMRPMRRCWRHLVGSCRAVRRRGRQRRPDLPRRPAQAERVGRPHGVGGVVARHRREGRALLRGPARARPRRQPARQGGDAAWHRLPPACFWEPDGEPGGLVCKGARRRAGKVTAAPPTHGDLGSCRGCRRRRASLGAGRERRTPRTSLEAAASSPHLHEHRRQRQNGRRHAGERRRAHCEPAARRRPRVIRTAAASPHVDEHHDEWEGRRW